ADGAKYLLHRRRLADDLWRVADMTVRFVVVLLAAVGERPAHQGDRLVYIEGLGQISEGAALVGGHGAVQVGMGGHDDDRQLGIALPDTRQQFQAAGARHADIADQDVGTLVTLQAGQGAVGTVEAQWLHAVLLQRLFQYPADGAVVINNPDVISSNHSSSPGVKSSGRNRVKTVQHGTLSHSIRPWCRVMMFWVIDRPRPVPSARPLTMG